MALCDQDNHGVLCALYTQEIWVRVDCVVNMCTSSACWYDAFMALAETNGYSTEIHVRV